MNRSLGYAATAMVLCFIAVLQADQSPGSSGLPPVDQRKACLSCHAEMEIILALPNVHQPLRDGKCSACHNPHAAKHAGLLDDGTAELCSRCHKTAMSWIGSPYAHDPVAKGRCTACHDAHGSKEDALLKNTPRELCANCHSEIKTWTQRAYVHDPVKRGQCDACHDIHAGKEEHLLKDTQARVCLACHESNSMFAAAHRGFSPQTTRCSACHDPHSGETASLMMAEVHSPFADHDCGACHVQNLPKEGGYPLKGSASLVCAECHSDEAAIVQRYSAHNANDKASCELCHSGHAAHEKNLLLLPERKLCRQCHVEKQPATSAPDPHAKLACITCHAPHGSGTDYYLDEPDLTLCAKCHTKEHHIAHPMGDTVIDKTSNRPLTCVSCHQLHGWKADPLLPASGDRDLCVRCHEK